MKYAELRNIDVSKQVEKKSGFSYLSWVWAVDQLLQLDETATWEYSEPKNFGDTLMVFCTVHAFGKSRTAQLPVMNYKNQAIVNPDAFSVNTAMQRCLAKAISLHGIGLYIYAGEDLPEDASKTPVKGSRSDLDESAIGELEEAAKKGHTAFAEVWKRMSKDQRPKDQNVINKLKAICEEADHGATV